MSSPTIDRRMGLVGNTAFKAPVRVATTGNITLSGEQTIDGVACVTGDRVLVVAQTNGVDNGIWDVSTGSWTRSKDANGYYDLVGGSTVAVTAGTLYAGSYWRLSNTGSVVVGTTALTWVRALASSLDSLSFLQRGTGADTRSAQEKARDFISILDFIPESEHAAIRAGTSTYDCYASIMEAYDSVTIGTGYQTAGPAIFFPPGFYKVNSTINLKKQVKLFGSTGGMPDGRPVKLIFPVDVCGIRIHAYNTLDTGVDPAAPNSIGGDGSIIEGLCLMAGTGSGAGGTSATAHGIQLRARAVIRYVTVDSFKGNGVHIEASAGGGGSTEGNANNWRIDTMRIEECGGHGLYVNGADSNAGVCSGVDATSNGGWGIYDSSFLGNTYIGCHTDNNTLGAYKTDDANARNVFLGCYSEGGQPTSDMVSPTTVVGGLYGSGITGNFTNIVDIPTRLRAFLTASTSEALTFQAGAIDPTDGNVTQLDCGDSLPFRFKYMTGKWFWNWANTGHRFMRFYNTAASTGNGYARTLTQGELGIRRFYLGDDAQMRLQDIGSPPTSTAITSLVGDVYWNTAGTSGTHAGWYCTVAGSPGTFRTFGTISTST